MKIKLSKVLLKECAHTLGKQLAATQVPAMHSACLETVSRFACFETWNHASAALSTDGVREYWLELTPRSLERMTKILRERLAPQLEEEVMTAMVDSIYVYLLGPGGDVKTLQPAARPAPVQHAF